MECYLRQAGYRYCLRVARFEFRILKSRQNLLTVEQSSSRQNVRKFCWPCGWSEMSWVLSWADLCNLRHESVYLWGKHPDVNICLQLGKYIATHGKVFDWLIDGQFGRAMIRLLLIDAITASAYYANASIIALISKLTTELTFYVLVFPSFLISPLGSRTPRTLSRVWT